MVFLNDIASKHFPRVKLPVPILLHQFYPLTYLWACKSFSLAIGMDLCPQIWLSCLGNIEACRSSFALSELGCHYKLCYTIQTFLKDAMSTGSMALIDDDQFLSSHFPI